MLIKNMMDDLGDSVGSTEVPIPNVGIYAPYSKLQNRNSLYALHILNFHV